jgi:hypothetical protein
MPSWSKKQHMYCLAFSAFVFISSISDFYHLQKKFKSCEKSLMLFGELRLESGKGVGINF